MKKILLLLLSATILLSACGKDDVSKKETKKATTTVTTTVTTTEATTTTAEPEPEIPEIEYTLLDGKKAINKEGNLFDCEIEAFSEYSSPYLYFYKDYIIAYECIYTYEEEIQTSLITILSLADGEVIIQKDYTEYGFCEFVVGENGLALHSYDNGKLYLLDDSLEITDEYDLSAVENYLILFNKNLKEVYSIVYDKGLVKLDLESGKEELIYESKNISVDSFSDGYCFFSITNPENYMNEHYFLDCNTGEITPTDLKNTGFINKSGNLIVYSDNNDNYNKFVRYNGEDKAIISPASYLRTTINAEKILLTDYDLNDVPFVCLYEPDGTFISKFEDNISNCYPSDYIHYNEKYDGYFFTFTCDSEVGSKLVFWDTEVEVEGDDLLVEDIFVPEEIVADVSGKIRDKVNDMEDKYGVDIKIAEECDYTTAGYTFELLFDENLIYQNLETIDDCMSKYPEGFFQQIKYGNIDHIEIQILNDMYSPEGVTMDASAFVFENPETIGVYFGSNQIFTFEVYHEFTHVIDFYLTFKKNVNDEILFDDQKWCEFNPEGYEYAESGNDSDIELLLDNYYVEGYFTEAYSCANSMEDRATLMSAAMIKNPTATAGRPLIEKLRYWSECIRDGFDTTGWEDVVLWEEILD